MMKISIKTLIIALSFAGIVQTVSAQTSANATKAESRIMIPDPVATMNGIPLSKADYEQFVTFLVAQGQPKPDSVEEISALIQDYGLQFILAEEARKKGLDKTDEFQLNLKMLEMSLLANKELMSKLEAVVVTDADITQEYERQKVAESGKEYSAAHILVATEAEANQIIKDLKGGKKFADAAVVSKDTGSAEQGGELGWFSLKLMVPEFSQAVEKMKKGEISTAPVKTDFGYHVILLNDVREVEFPALAIKKPEIEALLKAEKSSAVIEDFRKNAKIEIFIKESEK